MKFETRPSIPTKSSQILVDDSRTALADPNNHETPTFLVIIHPTTHEDTHEQHDTVTAVPITPWRARNFSRQTFRNLSVPNTCHDLFSDHNLCKVISTCLATHVQLSISCLLVVSSLSGTKTNKHTQKNKTSTAHFSFGSGSKNDENAPLSRLAQIICPTKCRISLLTG